MISITLDGKEFEIPGSLSEWPYKVYLPYSEHAMDFKRKMAEGDTYAIVSGVAAVTELLGDNFMEDEDIELSSKLRVCEEIITLMDAVEVNYVPPIFTQSGYFFKYKGVEYKTDAVCYCGNIDPSVSYGRYVEYMERRRKVLSGDIIDRFTFDLETVSIFSYKLQEDGSLLSLKSNVDEGAIHFTDIDVENIRNICFFLSGLMREYDKIPSLHFISSLPKEKTHLEVVR